MKKNIFLFLLFSLLISKSYAEKNIVENIIENIIEKNLPYVLYEHIDKQWDMGIYSLKIERLGKSNFVSSKTQINLSFPVKAKIDGQIKQNVLGSKFTLGCKSEFFTKAKIKITPNIKANNSNSKVNILVSIPPTNLKCEGLTIPIKPILETLIKDKINTWEQELESNVNNLLKQAHI